MDSVLAYLIRSSVAVSEMLTTNLVCDALPGGWPAVHKYNAWHADADSDGEIKHDDELRQNSRETKPPLSRVESNTDAP